MRTVYVDRAVDRVALALPPSVAHTTATVDSQSLDSEELADVVRGALPTRATRGATLASGNSASVRSVEHREESGLSRERAVLDPARAALAAGEPTRALERVMRHEKEYPNGILSEEREAIAINALVRLGNYAQASKRAATFRARFPQSLLMHSVEAAVSAVPK